MKKYVLILCVFLTLNALSVFASRDEATVKANWNFDNGDGTDASGNDVNGTIVGEPEVVDGIVGKAFKFDGIDDGIKFPDEEGINTGGPFTNRTIAAFFKCTDVSISDHKQTIFEEGGRSRGLVLNVYEGNVYVGAWNRAEYQWAGAWPSVTIESDRWYHVALVLREGGNQVEPDKFEMWLDGVKVSSDPGGQVFAHGADIGIAHTNGDTFFHDESGQGNNIHFFGGVIDEVIVYNSAFDEDDFAEFADVIQAATSVEPQDKFTTTWAKLKKHRFMN